MIQQHIFVCGEGLLSHPVSNLFHLGSAAHGMPDSDSLQDKKLVIMDCRNTPAGSVAAILAQLPLEMPLLMLCPGVDHIQALQGRYDLLPKGAKAAILARAYKNSCGLYNCVMDALEYTANVSAAGEGSGPSRIAEQGAPPENPHDEDESCECTDFEQLARALVTPQAANDFYTRAEAAMEETLVELDSPPTGVKYYMQNYNASFSYEYSAGSKSNKSEGSADFTWIVWAFLSQSESQNEQYLSVQGNLSLYAGKMRKNDSCDRGFFNTYFKGTLEAPMSKYEFSPTTGKENFDGSVNIAISYESPTGGYQIWDYEDSISYSINKWKAASISSGSALGAEWYMYKPFNGSNTSGDWQDGFSTWGHVKSISGASKDTVEASSLSTWYTDTLLDGYVSVDGDFGWQGARLWGTSCSPGVYWHQKARWNSYSNRDPGFLVNFSSLQPD